LPIHDDIVEVTETILQWLNQAQKGLTPALGFARGKYAGKKFGGVAGFLDLDAQFMPASRIELAQFAAALQDLFPAPLKLTRGKFDDREVTPGLNHGIIGLKPVAGLDPGGEID
jgi:hypothetical protein